MEKHNARIQDIKTLLESDKIDLIRLREYSSTGCPNEGGHRSLIWKILLNYLPNDRTKWGSTLTSRRNEYREFVREIIIRPGYKENNDDDDDDNKSFELDHPLSSGANSEWGSYFKANETLLQIDKDVRRLCPDLFFFQRATEFPGEEMINKAQSLRKRVAYTQLKADEVSRNRSGITFIKSDPKKKADDSEYTYLPEGQEAHWEIVQRILFIFARLNPGQSYVQGMNEICGPIYYTFANDPNIEWRQHAEADCFFCFSSLMGLEGVRENFVAVLDDTQWGIGSNMKRLYNLVKTKDVAVYYMLEKQNLKPEFFAFRWLTLLLSQEFPLPEVISLWDALFADNKSFDLLLHVCCAMILLQRDNLIRSDFSTNIKILQNYPPSVDIQLILSKARKLREN